MCMRTRYLYLKYVLLARPISTLLDVLSSSSVLVSEGPELDGNSAEELTVLQKKLLLANHLTCSS